ncbi:cbb3-type cytochrome oxidase assembly protein CcoS [Rhodothalassium salexigens]|uniref:cbb3-type cytochrome oxidase assembly protein CcoS n=1 Tax=Rhodothalassium salexigens TaxID=1086 RepID=UPI0019128CB0|nr:cbb3-type cytochrome oxidase assembly protein CcoS [Rhodothalassium salexigens]MBK5911997.1 cbb3-type cytochrome oxidase assembly protein CcoS [Rhodothalassium salexigens]
MSVLLVLIPIALFLGALGLAGFLWSLRAGQYEDLDGAAGRILLDDDLPESDQRPAAGVEPTTPPASTGGRHGQR